MAISLYKPTPGETHAFRTKEVGGVNQEWYMWAGKGTRTTDPRWKIVKMEYDGSNNWTEKYPKDPVTGVGSDAPKFKLSEYDTYTYVLLGTSE